MRTMLSDVQVGHAGGCACGGMCGRCAPPEYRKAVQSMAQKSATTTSVGNLRATEITPGNVRTQMNGLGDLVMVVQ